MNQAQELKEIDFQERCDRFVAKEVYGCVSVEMDYILKQEDTEAPYNWDSVENLYYTYEQAKEYNIINEDVTEENYDPEPQGIFEWWYVSKWLAGRLYTKREPVIRTQYGTSIWGRTTTGQAIKMDGVIREIVAELGK